MSLGGFELAGDGDRRINSVLASRDGELVVETYRPPYRAETIHHLYSATKSVLSALVGIAIDDGLVDGVDQPIVDLLPDEADALRDPQVAGITLRHALTMTTGLEWGELDLPYMDPANPVRQMQQSTDWVRYVLERRVTSTPGTTFEYSSGASHLIAAALQSAVGTTLATFADERLFQPLEIRDWYWTADPRGVTTGGWGLHLRPRDMVRFGELYLYAGRWEGRALISEEWVRESTSRQTEAVPVQRGSVFRAFGRRLLRRRPAANAVGYGYHWWLPHVGGHAALGSAGQAIYVLPDERLVVAVTGGLSKGEMSVRRELIEERLVPALRSRPPARAPFVSDRTYLFDANASGIESLSLRFGPQDTATLDVAMNGKPYALAVGLDGTFRETLIDDRNSLGLRGAWADDRTFALEWCWLSSGERLDVTLRFDDDRVTFRAEGAIDGQTRHLAGHARPSS